MYPAVHDDEGLISHEMFAIDGVKLPSNASKQRSGTRADIEAHATKLEAMAQTLVERHRAADALPLEPTLAFKAAKRITRLDRDAKQMRAWLAAHPEDRRGPTGTVRQSNRTDNESAKMATSKGVIQGYTGVAAVDKAHQIIVEAQAHGTGSEQEALLSMVTAMAGVLLRRSRPAGLHPVPADARPPRHTRCPRGANDLAHRPRRAAVSVASQYGVSLDQVSPTLETGAPSLKVQGRAPPRCAPADCVQQQIVPRLRAARISVSLARIPSGASCQLVCRCAPEP